MQRVFLRGLAEQHSCGREEVFTRLSCGPRRIAGGYRDHCFTSRFHGDHAGAARAVVRPKQRRTPRRNQNCEYGEGISRDEISARGRSGLLSRTARSRVPARQNVSRRSGREGGRQRGLVLASSCRRPGAPGSHRCPRETLRMAGNTDRLHGLSSIFSQSCRARIGKCNVSHRSSLRRRSRRG